MYSRIVEEHLYANATRDEVWTASAGALTQIAERYEKGLARTRPASAGFDLLSTDSFAGEQDLEQSLEEHIALHGERTASSIAGMFERARIRIVQHARAVLRGAQRDLQSWRMVVLTTPGGWSLVTAPEHLSSFRQLLDRSSEPLMELPRYDDLPVEWAGGTAAVLMHEAVGHPAEQGRFEIAWPEWLSVRDEPQSALFSSTDDCGEPLMGSELTRGERPLAWRRTSFRDVPMQRMSAVEVSATGVAALLPGKRIRVYLLGGGRYDPLADRVSLRIIGADLITGSAASPLAPFTIEAPRAAIAAALVGQCGPPAAYPGVACFDEGQRLFVGSRACALLTRPLREVM